jgi:HEAT repeat protein
VDTRSAAAGLEREFKTLASAQPQPAWIGYTAPVLEGHSLGCELVSPNGWWAPGVVHLESPDHMVVLFRVESSAVERVRAISPDCEIDAGGAPVHWLSDGRPAESIAMLSAMAALPGRAADGALTALALHADASADAALESLVAPAQPASLRERAVYWLGVANGGGRIETLQRLLAAGLPEAVEQRAVSGLGAGKSPAATDLLISIAHEDRNPRMRAQAVSALARKSDRKAVDAIVAAIQKDPDVQVQRRAVTALQSLPDAAGIPLLIQTAKTSQSAEVRKQAMSCLSQSRDPRAASFFEDLLKK